MNEFIEQFLIEARELVEQAMDDLIALEGAPRDKGKLEEVFRAFHTLKGSAGIVDFDAMGRALHAAEDVLGKVRAGDLPVTASLISDALASLDQVAVWLDQMETLGEPPADADEAADALAARFSGTGGAIVPAPTNLQAGQLSMARDLIDAQLALLNVPTRDGLAGRIGAAGRASTNVLRVLGRTSQADAAEAACRAAMEAGDAEPLAVVLRQAFAEAESSANAPHAGEGVARVMRVDIERVDTLVRLTGELSVAKNAIGFISGQAQEGGDPKALAGQLKAQHAVLERLIEQLQHAVLNIRVLPLRQVFQRFPRMVREIAASLGKPVRFVTEGDDTEADKAVVEALFEPLLHVIRNALDHGVENALVRAAASKPPIATLTLRAERRGEHVVIEVQDDGGGIDIARVRQVAAERGVATSEALAQLSDAQAVDLIFAAGFSTATEVTAVSGRGVGMDAVRAVIERLGGKVTVDSVATRGSTVRFNLPFTVMMTRVMTVEAGGQVFGVPLASVIETVRTGRDAIAPIGAARAFVLRNRTLPLLDLPQMLGTEQRSLLSEAVNIVVVDAAYERVGLQVDRIGEPMDVMLKPMDGLLAGAHGIAGTTLLGDGRVLLVLDLNDLV